jgi:hypothetical protein
MCSGNQLSQAKCSGSATGCPAAGTPNACPGFLICADGTSCDQKCSGDGDCVGGYWCNGSNCVQQSDYGGACSASDQCLHGNCIDGACCRVAGCGGCYACNLSGDGSCTAVGLHQDPHGICSADKCQNGCDGSGSCFNNCRTAGTSCRCGGVCLMSNQMCP